LTGRGNDLIASPIKGGYVKVLITGGAGFIGSHLAERLLKDGHEVTIIDDLSTGSRENFEHLTSRKNFHWVIDTILNRPVLEKLVADCQMIYHLAAAVGVQYVIQNPLKSLQINIEGTEQVLELALQNDCRVLVTSTSETYGKSERIPFREDDDVILGATTVRRWGYAYAKAVDEFLCFAYYREKKLPVVVARLFNITGPRQTGAYGMVVPRFVKQALMEQPLTVYGDGKQSRCFTHVSDAVEGLVALAENPEAAGQVFNVGSDFEITIEDLARKIKEMTGSPSEIKYIPYEDAYEKGFEDMSRRLPDISKIQRLTGYQPQASLEEILKEVIEYHKH
jgi:UDP-glucose 4-epimerase